MFDRASVLCREITQQLVNPWIFSGFLINTDIQDHIPKKLYTFIHWVIQGPAFSLQTSSCEMSVHQNVMTITQNILYAFKSECQVQYKPKNEESLFCHRYEWPQLLAVAIAVHKATRSKKLIQFLHGFALSVDYSHVGRLSRKLMRMFFMLSTVLVKATNYQMPPSQELNNMSASYIFLVHKLLRLVLYIRTFSAKSKQKQRNYLQHMVH